MSKKKKIAYPSLESIIPLPFYAIDNHTHIDLCAEYAPDGVVSLTPEKFLEYALKTGVKKIVQCGCSLKSALWSVELAKQNDSVVAAIGLHPNEAPELKLTKKFDNHFEQIAQLASENPKVRAIGETGLDFFRTENSKNQDLQIESFRKHISLAKELDLAMQIHSREATSKVLEILKKDKAPNRTVFHCFSGNAELAKLCSKNGWFVSFAGNVTFKSNIQLQEACKAVDKKLLLTETDSPFLTPAPHRGQPNASYLMNLTVKFMADLLGNFGKNKEENLVEFCSQIAQNSFSAYGEW